MGKHSQCLELDWIGIFDSYLGPRWIIWGGTEQKDRAEGGEGVWERPSRRPTAICSQGSAAQEQQLQAGAKRSEQWPLRSRLSGEESFGARGRGSQLDGKGELEGAVFPLATRPSSSCAWHGLLQGSAEPQGPVATSPRTNSACPCTLVAQQRAEVNALITGTEFSKESELLLNVSRQSFGWRRPGSRTLPTLANLRGTFSLQASSQLWRAPSSHFSALISKADRVQLVCHGWSAACVELQRSRAAFPCSLASSAVISRHPLAVSKVGAPAVPAPSVGDKGKLSFSLHTGRSAAGLQQQPRV